MVPWYKLHPATGGRGVFFTLWNNGAARSQPRSTKKVSRVRLCYCCCSCSINLHPSRDTSAAGQCTRNRMQATWHHQVYSTTPAYAQQHHHQQQQRNPPAIIQVRAYPWQPAIPVTLESSLHQRRKAELRRRRSGGLRRLVSSKRQNLQQPAHGGERRQACQPQQNRQAEVNASAWG